MITDYAPASIYTDREIPNSFLCPATSATRTTGVTWVSATEYTYIITTVVTFESKGDVVLVYASSGVVKPNYNTPIDEVIADRELLGYCWRDVPSDVHNGSVGHLLCDVQQRARQYKEIQEAAEAACLESRIGFAKKVAKIGNTIDVVKAVARELGMPDYAPGMGHVLIFAMPHVDGFQAKVNYKSPVGCGKNLGAIARHLIGKAIEYARPSSPLALRLEF